MAAWRYFTRLLPSLNTSREHFYLCAVMAYPLSDLYACVLII